MMPKNILGGVVSLVIIILLLVVIFSYKYKNDISTLRIQSDNMNLLTDVPVTSDVKQAFIGDSGGFEDFFLGEYNSLEKNDREELILLTTSVGKDQHTIVIDNHDDYLLEIQAGDKIRFFIKNTSNIESFPMNIYPDMSGFYSDNPGVAVNSQKTKKWLKVIGSSFLKKRGQYLVKEQVIMPGEKYIIETLLIYPGIYFIRSGEEILGKIVVSGESTQEAHDREERFRNQYIGNLIQTD